MKLPPISWRSIVLFLFIAFIISYILVEAYKGGYDANVYLFASDKLFNGENPYGANPYNQYLYSPLFAIIIRPISILDFAIARVIWAALNIILGIRLWKITYEILKENLSLSPKELKVWSFLVFISAVAPLSQNFLLGQITIVILWLTFEGLHQIMNKNNKVKGSALLALGVNIKIIPLLALYYLFFKGHFKALSFSLGFVALSFFLPALVFGNQKNLDLLSEWATKINPTNNKYVFEESNRTQSLNAILPAFFYFNDSETEPTNLKRQILKMPEDVLLPIIQILRVLLVLSAILLIFYRYKFREKKSLYFFWEFSYLAVVSILVFPHQQKYALLYSVPAFSYLLAYCILLYRNGFKISFGNKLIFGLSVLLLTAPLFIGRDIIGNRLVNILDYYHITGLLSILILPVLYYVKPEKVCEVNLLKIKQPPVNSN